MRAVLRRTLIVSLAALLLAALAGASTIIVKLHFAPGKLAVKADAPTVSAGTSVQVPVTIADGRGNGAGWTLKVGSSALKVVSITAACAAGSTCTLPQAATGPSGTSVLTAARGSGIGIMNLVVTLRATSRTAVSLHRLVIGAL
jgi:hypothetical protein